MFRMTSHLCRLPSDIGRVLEPQTGNSLDLQQRIVVPRTARAGEELPVGRAVNPSFSQQRYTPSASTFLEPLWTFTYIVSRKFSLTDSLVAASIIAREVRLTTPSVSLSLLFKFSEEFGALCADAKGKSFSINLTDYLGHVNFSSEVTALRIPEGSLAVTETLLRQALGERIISALTINKLQLEHGGRQRFPSNTATVNKCLNVIGIPLSAILTIGSRAKELVIKNDDGQKDRAEVRLHVHFSGCQRCGAEDMLFCGDPWTRVSPYARFSLSSEGQKGSSIAVTALKDKTG
ncbi:ef2 [Planoprotostelium fungivorum]|uniref:Ef2 n=1 Tax=Planoprotostelium fungivorum TaxID=1890364 RepID=A0A2P6NV47_9EUKA|nr:ef2 [Planoprotostelium fungivorum]